MDWLVRKLLQLPGEDPVARPLPAARRSRFVLAPVAVLAIAALAAAPNVWPDGELKAQIGSLWDGLGAPPERLPVAPATTSRPSLRLAAAPIRVSGEVVVPERLAEIVAATGTLLAAEGVELQAEVSGKITSIEFAEGARVRAGDLLVKLNDADWRARRVAASHELDRARRAERRAAELLAQRFVRADEYDAALATVHVREAELALAEAEIAKTEIRAPFEGIAGLRYVSEGAFVNASTRIATLQRLDTLKLDFAVPERYAQQVLPGGRVSFTVAGSDRTFDGEVYAFDPRIDTETRTLLIRALCPNPGGVLLPGAFANVKLALGEVPNALLVPANAVIPDFESAYVFVIAAGHAELRRVTTGVRTASRVQIVSGLAPGEVIATSGLQRITHGAAVEADVRKPAESSNPAPRDSESRSANAQTMSAAR